MRKKEDRLAYRTAEDKKNYFAYRQALWDAVDRREPVSVVALAKKYKQL